MKLFFLLLIPSFLMISCSSTKSIQTNSKLSRTEALELGADDECCEVEESNFKASGLRSYLKSVKSLNNKRRSSPAFVPDRVFFGFDSSSLSKLYRKNDIKLIAKYLKTVRGKIKLSGYCDERGTIEYNYALGEKRAHNVKTLLVKYGIPPSRIIVRSFGKQKSAVRASNYTENRTVTIQV